MMRTDRSAITCHSSSGGTTNAGQRDGMTGSRRKGKKRAYGRWLSVATPNVAAVQGSQLSEGMSAKAGAAAAADRPRQNDGSVAGRAIDRAIPFAPPVL